jgi:diamine N-acetyltransferase
MTNIRGAEPLSYRLVARAELDVIAALNLDPEQVDRFLGPIDSILAAVRRGPAHRVVAIESSGALIGFYVVHPDPRDASCWWLGWLVLERAQQGCGYGRAAIRAVLDRLRRIDACRRIRLLVAAENGCARRLYARAGFRRRGTLAATGELILELRLSDGIPRMAPDAAVVPLVTYARRPRFRGHRTVGPHGARVIGVERGPPSTARLAPALRGGSLSYIWTSRNAGTTGIQPP